MDGLIGLVVITAVSALVAGPILSIIAIVRTSRIRRFERHMAELNERLRRVETGMRGPGERVDAPSTDPPMSAPSVPSVAPPEPAPTAPSAAPSATAPSRSTPPIPAAPAPPAGPSATIPQRSAPPPPPPSRPAIDIDWERWIGVRGAALVGSIALALAGLLFFKYSIERGLITPAMRVVLGSVTGLGCLAGSGWLRRREYVHTAEGLAGAGIVILYASFWAAHLLYDLIGMLVAFGLMLLVTVVCCLLAVRRESLVVAVLGLVGGFATPLLLAGGTDRPIGLFGYVLLLDLGLLAVGHKRRWPSLGILSLLGTVLLQAFWFGTRMGPDGALIGLGVLAIFAMLFVFANRPGGDVASGGLWLWSRVGAILFPFAFAVYFASRVELGPRLYPLALLLLLLCSAAAWLAREQRLHAIGFGAATAGVAVVAVWWLQQTIDSSLAWELAVVTVGLSCIFHFFVERDPEHPGIVGPAPAAMIVLAGFSVLLICAAATARVPVWPWLAGGAGLALLAYRHAGFPGRGFLQLGVAVGFGLGFSALHLSSRPILPPAWLFLALLIAVSALAWLAAWRRAESSLRTIGNHAAAALPVLLLVGLAPSAFPHRLAPLPALGSSLLLGLLAVLAATRLGRGAWYATAVGATLLSGVGWTISHSGLDTNPAEAQLALILMALTAVLFTVWPLSVPHRFATDRVAWYGAALAAPLWFLPLRAVFESRFGNGFVGLLPIALGALSLACALRLRQRYSGPSPQQRSALVWYSAAALCFLAVAIPLQLDREWITIGWALQGLAVIALWKKLDHLGLKYFGLFLLGAATLRLVANPALLVYYPRSTIRLVNWLLYTYLVPAAALLASSVLLRSREADRARAWERWLYSGGHAVGAVGSGLAAILVVFVWINLAVADWFATGTFVTLSFGDRPAQRLTVSIAWAIYGLVLLGAGMVRDSLGLRWLSLGFLLVTIGKVFLYDLGALQDLYRVASLVGLAASLILVSLLYQRFVFRRTGMERR